MTESDSEPMSEKFEPGNLRTVAGVQRATDDRWVAGVAAGIARHLNVDPVIIRIGFIGLTFIGLSGLILYVAGWFFLPSDDGRKSAAADWFNLDENEEQVRTIGLFTALVLAILSAIGDGGWGWSFGLGWVLIPLAFLYWLFVVRRRQKRAELAALTASRDTAGADANDPLAAYVAEKKAEAIHRIRVREQNRHSRRALFLLTVSIAAIAEAITMIVARAGAGFRGETYLVVALGAIAVGCLIGSLWGTAGGGLKFLGIALTLALALSTLNFSGPMGQQIERPTTAAEVRPTYDHGVGEFTLDLSKVRDVKKLAGRDIRVDTGVGQTLIYLPEDVPVALHAELTAGQIRVFGQDWHGKRNVVDLVDPDDARPSAKVMTINIDQSIGDVEVSRR